MPESQQPKPGRPRARGRIRNGLGYLGVLGLENEAATSYTAAERWRARATVFVFQAIAFGAFMALSGGHHTAAGYLRSILTFGLLFAFGMLAWDLYDHRRSAPAHDQGDAAP